MNKTQTSETKAVSLAISLPVSAEANAQNVQG